MSALNRKAARSGSISPTPRNVFHAEGPRCEQITFLHVMLSALGWNADFPSDRFYRLAEIVQ